MDTYLGDYHFYIDGEGPAIIFLHASPMDGSSMIPLMEKLKSQFTVIAVDTPGYGLSPRPETQPASIDYYADRLRDLLNNLGIEKTSIYGSATGAQIAICMANRHPQVVDQLFLDNTAHFSDKEREAIFDSYFPDFTPRADGSHIPEIWDNVRGLFEYFPWSFRTPEYKLESPIPPLFVLDKIMVQYVRTGAEYDWAYRVAFVHEDIKNLNIVKAPTHIFRWDGSILKPYIDRLFVEPLALNFSDSVIQKTDDRFETMANMMKVKYGHAKAVHLDLSAYIKQTPSKKEGISGLPKEDFPNANLEGTHWMEAWKKLDKNLSIKEKTEVLLSWASA